MPRLQPRLPGHMAQEGGRRRGVARGETSPFTSLDSAVFRPSSRSFQSLDSNFSMVGITVHAGRYRGQQSNVGGEDSQVSTALGCVPRRRVALPIMQLCKNDKGPEGTGAGESPKGHSETFLTLLQVPVEVQLLLAADGWLKGRAPGLQRIAGGRAGLLRHTQH